MDLKHIESQVEYWSKLAAEFQKPPTGFEDLICKKYLELESVTKVAKYLKESRIFKPSGALYISNDVSAVLKNKTIPNVQPVILEAARNKYRGACKFMRRSW